MIMWNEIQRRTISSLNLMFEQEQFTYPHKNNYSKIQQKWPIRIQVNSFIMDYVEIGGGPTGLILTVQNAQGRIRQRLYNHPDTQMQDMLNMLNKELEYGDQTRKTNRTSD